MFARFSKEVNSKLLGGGPKGTFETRKVEGGGRFAEGSIEG
jgi:hypothetical protein